MEEDLEIIERDLEKTCIKSRLVDDICSISKRSVFCHHHHHHVRARNVRFIDWYDVLGVEETALVHVIKKRYHKLALQLHPDKNKHPKAEFAFKLVSEAYVCLADSTKRRAFDLEKLRNLCYECNSNGRVAERPTADSPKKPPTFSERSSKSRRRILKSLKDIRERFREEAKVIENCVKANSLLTEKELPPFNIPNSNHISSSSRLSCPRKESPVFDPAHYAFHGYPHIRTRVNTDDEFRYFGGGGIKKRTNRSNYPLFGGGTENNYNERVSTINISRSRSACVRS